MFLVNTWYFKVFKVSEYYNRYFSNGLEMAFKWYRSGFRVVMKQSWNGLNKDLGKPTDVILERSHDMHLFNADNLQFCDSYLV